MYTPWVHPPTLGIASLVYKEVYSLGITSLVYNERFTLGIASLVYNSGIYHPGYSLPVYNVVYATLGIASLGK